MSSNIIEVIICHVDSESKATGRIKRTTTFSPEVFMMADAIHYDGAMHPIKRREANLDEDMQLSSITLLVY